MTKFKQFLRANAARIAVILCSIGCIITLAALAFSAAKDYENARVFIQPIKVGSGVSWLSAYRPVTFGDCPTQGPPNTTAPETDPGTTASETFKNVTAVSVSGSSTYDSYEAEQVGQASSGFGRSLGYFTCTAYCGCSYCSEGYGSMTATGVYARANHTIAVDPSVIPYGTWVVINGITYKAEDCGGGIKGNEIDIYFEDHAATEAFGVRTCEVFLA